MTWSFDLHKAIFKIKDLRPIENKLNQDNLLHLIRIFFGLPIHNLQFLISLGENHFLEIETKLLHKEFLTLSIFHGISSTSPSISSLRLNHLCHIHLCTHGINCLCENVKRGKILFQFRVQSKRNISPHSNVHDCLWWTQIQKVDQIYLIFC